MPIGGIGTGTIWLDGQGRLGVWQIFNNHGEDRIPDSFFALRAQPDGGEAVTRVLQTESESGFDPVPSLEFEAGYPIARLQFEDQALPVDVRMEAFNPMIPTDAPNSSIPCAIFRITARNTQDKPVSVSLLGTLQNAVGSEGKPDIDGIRFGGYGGNQNAVVREGRMTAVHLIRPTDPRPGFVHIRGDQGAVEAPPMLWLDGLTGLVETAESGPAAANAVQQMADIAGEGGVVVATDVRPEFLTAVLDVRSQLAGWDKLVVFDDFEDGDYKGWTVKGAAFADAPHTGTTAGQQPVRGYMGSRLVNTFVPNDQPQGELISDPFTIEHKHIGFLIGGGRHAGETCINLKVGGETVRTATGKNNERLEPYSWDVSEFVGKEGVIEIIDRQSGGWGHINIDHIVFADAPPHDLLKLRGPIQTLATELPLQFDQAELTTLREPQRAQAERAYADSWSLDDSQWSVREYVKLVGFSPAAGVKAIASTAAGDPLLLRAALGKATAFIALAPGMPWHWTRACLLTAAEQELVDDEDLVTSDPAHGTMALSTDVPNATWSAAWTDGEALAAEFSASGSLSGPDQSDPSPAGETRNSALCVRFRLQPGQERTTSFVVSWHFPNCQRFDHTGNQYSRRFGDALDVARYVCGNLGNLWGRTELYQQTVYESNLPGEFIDAMTSQSVIFRGPTCWWSENGYFAGYEGCYRCCPLNCTHVWNYAQSHARLFPEIDRNMRRSDLLVYLHPNGETSHRQHHVTGAFIDGHCATIEAALRAHQMSPDNSFLGQIWPNLKKATDWLIERIDEDHDGVPAGRQPNTYDCEVSGANTFIGSQYLSALAAAECLAHVMGDAEAETRWRVIRLAGQTNQDARLWNGEYYYQIPDDPPARDYNTGCHSDQLLGQWWAHMLNLGYLYPPERINSALFAIADHNFRESFEGFQQRPRRYVIDSEAGLLMCTWPKGGRPDPFIIYADEVWTGIEYSTAGLMVFEGMIDQARKIVGTARSRYDGRVREDLNSGPGGNPFNELECGKFYARAMSSWGLLTACQGSILDGPAGAIGFKPRWQPENHRSFFTGPEGWGLFTQARHNAGQTEELQVRHGQLSVKDLVFEVPAEQTGQPAARVTIGGRAVDATAGRRGREVRVTLADRVTVEEGEAIHVVLS
jgi:uncharacterized protein (DUF608 family)